MIGDSILAKLREAAGQHAGTPLEGILKWAARQAARKKAPAVETAP